MRPILILVTLFQFLLVGATSSFAQHEHLNYLLSSKDMIAADPTILNVMFKDLVPVTVMRMALDLSTTRQPNFENAETLIYQNPEASFGEVAEWFRIPPEDLLTQLVSFKKAKGASAAKDRSRIVETYKAKERVRTNVIGILRKRDFLAKAFQEANLSALKNQGEIFLSVPPSYFHNLVEMEQIKKSIQRTIPEVHFLASLSRNTQSLKRDLQFLASLDPATSLVSGVDITGSLDESGSESSKEFNSSFESVLDLIEQRGWIARFHAFEGSRTGEFYDRFWSLLSKRLTHIPQIRIGHISELTNRDILELRRLEAEARKGESNSSKSLTHRLVFEANVESNILLQGADPSRIAMNIRHLQRLGFKVVLGTDGLNPLSSTLLGGLKLLAPYLSRSEIQHLWFKTVPKSAETRNQLTDVLATAKVDQTHSTSEQRVHSWRKVKREHAHDTGAGGHPKNWIRPGR